MTDAWSRIQWGTAPAAASAFLSLLTVLIALSLIRRQRIGLDEQRRMLRDQQAHRVTAWVEANQLELSPEEANGYVWHRVTVENSGDEAVYGVRVVSLKRDAKTGEEIRAYGSPVAVLAARSKTVSSTTKPDDEAVPRIELSFMDSRGVHWVRSYSGVLRRVDFPVAGSALIIGHAPRHWYDRVRHPAKILQKEERSQAWY
jgi:hypothetical protein